MSKLNYIDFLIAQRGLCFYCGKPMSHIKNQKFTGWTKDHFYPKKDGNKINGNMVLCHAECNSQKAGRQPTEKEKEKFISLYKQINKRKKGIKKIETNKKIKFAKKTDNKKDKNNYKW